MIEGGQVVDTTDSKPAFEAEGVVWVRELGLGLNRAFTEERVVTDIGTFERMCGVHLSLGAKHVSYNKPEIKKKAARFHGVPIGGWRGVVPRWGLVGLRLRGCKRQTEC